MSSLSPRKRNTNVIGTWLQVLKSRCNSLMSSFFSNCFATCQVETCGCWTQWDTRQLDPELDLLASPMRCAEIDPSSLLRCCTVPTTYIVT